MHRVLNRTYLKFPIPQFIGFMLMINYVLAGFGSPHVSGILQVSNVYPNVKIIALTSRCIRGIKSLRFPSLILGKYVDNPDCIFPDFPGITVFIIGASLHCRSCKYCHGLSSPKLGVLLLNVVVVIIFQCDVFVLIMFHVLCLL